MARRMAIATDATFPHLVAARVVKVVRLLALVVRSTLDSLSHNHGADSLADVD